MRRALNELESFDSAAVKDLEAFMLSKFRGEDASKGNLALHL